MILVTGGAGFIGSHIVERLVSRGDRVRVLDNFATGKHANLAPFMNDIELVTGDIRDADTCRMAVSGADVILHQAAVVSVEQSAHYPALVNAVNVSGTLNMLVAARDAEAETFIMASSAAVYGDDPLVPQQEGREGFQLSPYAVGKLAGERYCRVFHTLYGMRTAALRYFNVYGPRQDAASDYATVIPKFIARMIRGDAPVIHGNGEQSRDFVYVGDVAEANLLALHSPGPYGEPMNIASGQEISVNALVNAINVELGTDIFPSWSEARPGDIKRSWADISRARERLGFAPSVAFQDGLSRTVRWYRERN